MPNLKEEILNIAEGELIQAVVIGEMGWGEYSKERVPNYDQQPKGKVLSWHEAAKWLDYDYDNDANGKGCDNSSDWTGGHDFTADGMLTASGCDADGATVYLATTTNYFSNGCSNGGGHAFASGATIFDNIENAEALIIPEAKAEVEEWIAGQGKYNLNQ